MAVYLLPSDGSSTVIGFGQGSMGNSADLVMTENHESTIVVTEHPVEEGSNVSDHVREIPAVFSLDVFVTNHPITTDELADNGAGRGFIDTVDFEAPKYTIPFEPTPGGLFRAAGGALSAAADALMGGQSAGPTKIQVLTFDAPFNRPREVWALLTTFQKAAVLFDVVTTVKTYSNVIIERAAAPIEEPGGATITIEFKTINMVSTNTTTAPKPLEKRGAPKASKGGQSTTKDPPIAKASLAIKAAKAAMAMFGSDSP